MKSKVTGALLALGIALASLATTALPAAASTSGSESVKGIIVASGVSGSRTPVFSVAVATGVFRGVGQIVGVPPKAGDAANIFRADLVYPVGTMHLVSTSSGATFTVDPRTCLFHASTQQTRTSRAGPGCSSMRAAPSPAQ
jgi:hypothetical protein